MQPLQEQCSVIISQLLETFNSNTKKEAATVLGEQLQFLVSKLLACCIPSENHGETTVVCSSRVIALLHQLTIEADPSLHEYIRELEPFPDLKCLDRLRIFHDELCKAYSPRDHFLKFVRRTCYFPQGLLPWRFGKIFTSNLLGSWSIVSTDPEINRLIFKNDEMFETDWSSNLKKLLSEFAVIFLAGDEHKRTRSVIQNFLSIQSLRTVCVQDASEFAFELLSS